MFDKNSNYKKLYLKYKSKYLALKRQLGGSSNNEIQEKLRLDMVSKRFPVGRYRIHVKKLNPTLENKLKICHHYSMFSLIDDIPTNECCGADGPFYLNVIRNRNFNVRELIQKQKNRADLIPIEATVRLYDFNTAGNNGNDEDFSFLGMEKNTNFPHSAREIGNLVWHKFNTNDFIFAIESNDERIKDFNDYKTIETIQIQTYAVPSNIFEGGIESEQIFEIVI